MATKARVNTVAGLVAGLMLGSICLSARAESKPLIYAHAPQPATLAAILFPPKYRGMGKEGAEPKGAREFGMKVHFAYDSAAILPESRTLLDSVGEMLQLEKVGGRGIVIEGHTDAVGSDRYNQGLSERRASAIKNYLVKHHKVVPTRLVTTGKGEKDLYNPDDPKAAVNRRAMFKPLTKLVLK